MYNLAKGLKRVSDGLTLGLDPAFEFVNSQLDGGKLLVSIAHKEERHSFKVVVCDNIEGDKLRTNITAWGASGVPEAIGFESHLKHAFESDLYVQDFYVPAFNKAIMQLFNKLYRYSPVFNSLTDRTKLFESIYDTFHRTLKSFVYHGRYIDLEAMFKAPFLTITVDDLGVTKLLVNMFPAHGEGCFEWSMEFVGEDSALFVSFTDGMRDDRVYNAFKFSDFETSEQYISFLAKALCECIHDSYCGIGLVKERWGVEWKG